MGTEDRAYRAGGAGEQESGEKESCKIYHFCRSGEHNTGEDKIEVDPQKGLVVLVDMMGEHGKGYRVVLMSDGKSEVMSELQYAREVLGEKSISSSDQDQQKRIEQGFGRYPTVGSWAGDKLVNNLAHDLEMMNVNFVHVEDLERDLKSIARKGNEALGEANTQLHQMGLPAGSVGGIYDTGGVGVFGKLVTVGGERHWAGLRIGDVRIGIRRANGKIEILPCGRAAIESYAEGDFNSLNDYLNSRNIVGQALLGRESNLKGLKLVDIPVEKGDQMIFLTDGITDSLEWVQKPLLGRLDPWKVLKEIWNDHALTPEEVVLALAERAAALTQEYQRLRQEGKKKDVIGGCLPKRYLDDQAGALVVIGGELTAVEKEEAKRQGWQEVAERFTKDGIEQLADLEKNNEKLKRWQAENFNLRQHVKTLFHWFGQVKPELRQKILSAVGEQLELGRPATPEEFRKAAEEKIEEMIGGKK